MGCRNRELSEEEIAVTASIGDALLFTTMCIIGLPVDVHIKDGSIYSGIFHTVCLDNEYGIVLKKAMMTKKGNLSSNVSNGGVVETLVVLSEDLVQVIAKGIQLLPNGLASSAASSDIGASIESAEVENKLKRSTKTSQTRSSSRAANGLTNGFKPNAKVENGESVRTDFAKKEETSSSQVTARQIGDGEKQNNCEDKHSFQKCNSMHENVCEKTLDNPASIIKFNSRDQEKSPSKETSHSNASADTLESSTTTEMNPEKASTSNRVAKEFKLNPGAKIFSPSFVNQRSITPVPAVQSSANVNTYAQENNRLILPIPVSVQHHQDIEISPFAPPRTSLPLKYLPYGNIVPSNGVNDIQYSQPIVGHMGNRAQPTRYAGQFHLTVQASPTYVHPNSQNVMVGQLGPLVYMQPVSHDMVQGGTAFSQVSACPVPHHLPKHQGNGAAAPQGLQLCVTAPPPYIGNGQQTFTVPAHLPLSQQSFPIIRPFPLPGTNAFLPTKFS